MWLLALRSAAGAVLLLALLALGGVTRARAAEGDEPYAGMVPLAGDSHQHAATIYMITRSLINPPVPGFPSLHENTAPGDAYDALRRGGYDWASLSHHDTNFPGQMANVCIDTTSDKYRWWVSHMNLPGFQDATRPGATVSPASNESIALSRIADSKTVEGVGGFLAFTGREFTNYNFFPTGVGPREGGHKVIVFPRATGGMCTGDGLLKGDEYCKDENRMYQWLAKQSDPRPPLIQAHPGFENLDFRPYHPKNAPGGLSDQFVVGMEVGSIAQDPQWESTYNIALRRGYRLFPAYGSDDHYATYPGLVRSPAQGATVCWAAGASRTALAQAMLARRCYFSSAWRPELRFSVRPHAGGAWQPMGADVSLGPDGLADVRVHVRNDPRNRNADPTLGKRFDALTLVDEQGGVVASCGSGVATIPANARACSCVRSPDGFDTCTLEADGLRLHAGAFYPRVLMNNPAPAGCRSQSTPALLPLCRIAIIGGPVFVNWPAFTSTGPYRQCVLDPKNLPCGTPGCLPAAVDHDQDGWPDDCDVCPALSDPDQLDSDKDGFGDRCGRPPLEPPSVLGAG